MMSYSLIRADNIKRYIKDRIISLGTVGFIMAFLLQLILLIGLLILFPITGPNPDQAMLYYGQDLYLNNPFIYSLIIMINTGLMAFFFTCLSVIISILFENLYALLCYLMLFSLEFPRYL